VVAVLANGSRFSIGHVGDSRVYLFADGTPEQLTFDDSWATVVAQDPSLNANDIAHNPMRDVLTSVFGARHCRHSLERAELSPGDILLLVSEEVGDAAGESWHMRVRARDIGPMKENRRGASRVRAERQRAGIEHPDEVHTRCMVLVDLLFHLAPRLIVAEHFDDELGSLFHESRDLRAFRNPLVRDERHVGSAHRVGSAANNDPGFSREHVAETMGLVVHLEEKEGPSGDFAVTKPARRDPDNFSPHKLARPKHVGDASKLFRPQQS
jgi:hypothetical protein